MFYEYQMYAEYSLIFLSMPLSCTFLQAAYDDMICSAQSERINSLQELRENTQQTQTFVLFIPSTNNREKDDRVRSHSFLPATHLQPFAHILGLGT
jgi:hypothetical protein